MLRMHHGDRPNPDDASIEAGLSIDQVKDEVADVHPGAVYLVLVEVVHHAKGKVRRPLSLVACVDALNDCPSLKATRPVGIRLQQQPLALWGSEKVARGPGDADRLPEKPGTSFYNVFERRRFGLARVTRRELKHLGNGDAACLHDNLKSICVSQIPPVAHHAAVTERRHSW